MTGNRVEELEATVRELQASVNGLTDELVETKERLRYLEDQVGTDVDGIIEGRPSRSEARRSVDAGAGQQSPAGGAGAAAPQGQQSAGQPSGEQSAQGSQPASQEAVDQAVQQTDESADAAADGGKSDEIEGGEEEAEQGDDIIVA